MASVLATVLGLASLTAAGTTFLQVEARSSVAELELSPGAPIAWSLKDAQLLECDALRAAALRTGSAAGKPAVNARTLDETESIELAAGFDKTLRRLDTVQANIVLDGDVAVIELRALQRHSGAAVAATGGCDATASRAAVLEQKDGQRRGLQLPAQLRVPAKALGVGLTLEFRGALRVGRDVTSSRQPLLSGGRVVLREVRARWLQGLVTNAHFEVESRELGLGDKLTLRAPDASSAAGAPELDVPQGFVRLVQGERGIDMSVSATAQAARAEIVRPFSRAETPQVNALKVASRDDLVQMLFVLLVTLWSLGLALYPLLPEESRSPVSAPGGPAR